MIGALIIFLITYFFIGLRQIPRVHIDRPAGALVGAVLMIVFGILSLDQAFSAIDMHTLLLLLGMMIITVYLRTAGFFEYMADKILTHSKTPLQLLIFIVFSSGLLSALFVNDTICLLYTPIILELTIQLKVNPLPYLLALATSSNVGSVMTVTGNPQNMLIGIYSHIPYLSFLGALFPVALAGLIICVVVIRHVYRREMKHDAFSSRPRMPEYKVRKPLLIKALLVCGAVLVAFSLGYSYSLVAAGGAVLLLVIGGVSTAKIFEEVDWTLLLFFSGLFVVMRGVEQSGLAAAVIGKAGDFASFSALGRIAGFSAVSVVLSNLVSNVPAVMLLKPLTSSIGGGPVDWLVLAMSSTLAGNLTLMGSVANLIVAQQAKRRVEIGFMEYFRVGALITVLTVGIGILVLFFQVKIANGAEAVNDAKQDNSSFVTVISGDPSGGQRRFKVVLTCNTDELRTRGLQGYRKLNADETALFIFPQPEITTFWMGSVAFAIDIVFVDHRNNVFRVYSRCLPGSRDYYPSGMPVHRVLETAAGSGIKPGDKILLE